MRIVRLPDDLAGGWHARVADVMREAFHAGAAPRAAPHKRWWGVLDGARLVAATNLEAGVLWDLGVLPSHQRRGVGGALVAHVLRRWRGDVRVFLARADLRAWYAARGFAPDERTPLPPRAMACLVRRAVRRNGRQESGAPRQSARREDDEHPSSRERRRSPRGNLGVLPGRA